MPASKHNTKLKEKLNINFKAVWVNSVILLLIVYFCYHSFSGQRGFIAFLRLNKDIKEKVIELSSLEKERQSIENKVKLLYPNTLDIDMLDEIARREMGLIAKEEKVIILTK
jgi:cell division protein FtsB